LRQPLTAGFLAGRKAVPAAFDPAMVKFAPTGGCCDFAVFKRCSVLVGDAVERGNLFGSEAPGFVQNGIHQIIAEFGMLSALLQV
jgi:hypothetical protein